MARTYTRVRIAVNGEKFNALDVQAFAAFPSSNHVIVREPVRNKAVCVWFTENSLAVVDSVRSGEFPLYAFAGWIEEHATCEADPDRVGHFARRIYSGRVIG